MGHERILIVEDERAVARGLQYAFEKEGYRVSLAVTGQEGIEKARVETPDLLILDIRLPDISGFDVCRTLRKELKQPILMLTARDEETDKVLGLELGADDYVTKPFGLRELLSRVRALLRRAYGDLASDSATQRLKAGELTLDLQRQQAYRNDQLLDLTTTEFKLLTYLATHPERPFTREELIHAAWGYSDYYGDERTVDVHIRHIREKIEANPAQPRYIVTVRGIGYRFQAQNNQVLAP
jgi:DNA-binding response OmpR family regulator